MSRREIKLDGDADRWRYVCPAGHRSWEPTNEHFWCAACARALDDVDPSFEQLRDRKTDELLERGDVQLLTDVGPYQDIATEAGI